MELTLIGTWTIYLGIFPHNWVQLLLSTCRGFVISLLVPFGWAERTRVCFWLQSDFLTTSLIRPFKSGGSNRITHGALPDYIWSFCHSDREKNRVLEGEEKAMNAKRVS